MIYQVWVRAYRAKIMIDHLVPSKLLRAMLCSHILRTNASIGARIDYCDVDRIKDCSFRRARYLERNINHANVTKRITEEIRATQRQPRRYQSEILCTFNQSHAGCGCLVYAIFREAGR